MRASQLILVALAASSHSILQDADWGGILWNIGWAVLMSFSSTMYRRNQAIARGEQPTNWSQIWPEAAVGAMLGIGLSIGLPTWKPQWFANLGAELLLSMGGGWLGPPGWGLLQRVTIKVGLRQLGVETDKEDKDDGPVP